MKLEAAIERALMEHAQTKNVRTFKFTSPGDSGVPDRMFIGPWGKIGFLEIKAPGKIPTALQQSRLDDLLSRSVPAGWTDNIPAGKRFIDSLT